MTTRRTKGASSRLSTRRSRKNSPAKASTKVPLLLFRSSRVWVVLLTEVPPGQLDKDGLEAGFANRDIAHAKYLRPLHDLGEDAVGRLCKDADAVRRRLGA